MWHTKPGFLFVPFQNIKNKILRLQYIGAPKCSWLSELIYLTKKHITNIFEQVDQICYCSRLTQSFSIKNTVDKMFFSTCLLCWQHLHLPQNGRNCSAVRSHLVKDHWKSFWVFWTFKDKYLNVQPGHRSLQTLPPSPSPNSQCLVHGLHLR